MGFYFLPKLNLQLFQQNGKTLIGSFYAAWLVLSSTLLAACCFFPEERLDILSIIGAAAFGAVFASGCYPLLFARRYLRSWCAAALSGMVCILPWTLTGSGLLAAAIIFPAIPFLGPAILLVPFWIVGLFLTFLSVLELLMAAACGLFFIHFQVDAKTQASETGIPSSMIPIAGGALALLVLAGAAAPALGAWTKIRQREAVASWKRDVEENIQSGRIPEVEQLFAKRPDLLHPRNLYLLNGEDLVNSAAQRGDVKTVKFLLDHGFKMTPTAAIALDDTEQLSQWIERRKKGLKSKSEMEESFGTLMLEASRKGRVECVKVFLSHGIEVDLETYAERETALHAAVKANNENMAGFLLASGANASHLDRNRFNPLRIALQQGNLSMAGMLVKAGADVNGPGQSGSHLASALNDDRYEQARWLLKWKADSNCRLSNGITGLDWTIGRCGSTSASETQKEQARAFVAVLIDSGASVQPSEHGNPLKVACLVAAKTSNLEILRSLLAAGADVNAKDQNGDTILHLLAAWPERISPEAIKLLLEAGANPAWKNNAGQTPTDLAKTCDSRFSREPPNLHLLSLFEDAAKKKPDRLLK